MGEMGNREYNPERRTLDIPFGVPNQNKVTHTSVADVGVNGDRTSRVSLLSRAV